MMENIAAVREELQSHGWVNACSRYVLLPEFMIIAYDQLVDAELPPKYRDYDCATCSAEQFVDFAHAKMLVRALIGSRLWEQGFHRAVSHLSSFAAANEDSMARLMDWAYVLDERPHRTLVVLPQKFWRQLDATGRRLRISRNLLLYFVFLEAFAWDGSLYSKVEPAIADRIRAQVRRYVELFEK